MLFKSVGAITSALLLVGLVTNAHAQPFSAVTDLSGFGFPGGIVGPHGLAPGDLDGDCDCDLGIFDATDRDSSYVPVCNFNADGNIDLGDFSRCGQDFEHTKCGDDA